MGFPNVRCKAGCGNFSEGSPRAVSIGPNVCIKYSSGYVLTGKGYICNDCIEPANINCEEWEKSVFSERRRKAKEDEADVQLSFARVFNEGKLELDTSKPKEVGNIYIGDNIWVKTGGFDKVAGIYRYGSGLVDHCLIWHMDQYTVFQLESGRILRGNKVGL